MSIRKLALIALATAGVSSLVGVAHAQKVFVVNDAAVLRNTKLGKELGGNINNQANKGVEQLGLQALSDQIDTERKALDPILGSLTPEARDAKIKSDPALKAKLEALGKKQVELQQKEAALNNALGNATDDYKSLFDIAMIPAIEFVAKEANADIVVPVGTLFYAKQSTDLTQKVIARVDATVPNIAKLEEIIKASQAARQAAAGAAPPASAPVAPAKPPGG